MLCSVSSTPIRSPYLLLAAPLLFVLLCFYGVERSTAQFIVAPLVIAGVWRIGILTDSVPRPIVFLILAGTLLSAYHNFSPRGDPSRTFYVSRLKDDTFETESRIFREEINQKLARSHSAEAARHPRDIQSIGDASAVFKNEPLVQGLVWGSTRWINVSLRPRTNLLLRERGVSKSFPEVSDLELVDSIPAFGLSYLPRAETAQFLTEFFSGVLPVTQGVISSSTMEWSRRMLSFRSAAGQRTRWSTSAHQSYPWLLVGNLHFIAAFEHEQFQPGELRCAIEAYTKARHLLRLGDNPELLAAILSNKGSALLVKGILNDQPQSRLMGRELLRRASRMTAVRNPYRIEYISPTIARRNLRKLRVWVKNKGFKSTGKVRKNKRKGKKLRGTKDSNVAAGQLKKGRGTVDGRS